MTLLVFIIILSILILVHEWGHFITARKCGIHVEQFSLGFGPKLFSRMHDGTEFCLCAIPLGGYVKMAGDERDKCHGAAHEFFSKTVGQRSLVVLMGPVVNIVFAYVCLWAVFMIGYVDLDASLQKLQPIVNNVVVGSPAQEAGLIKGDRILSINGSTITHWFEIPEKIRASTTKEVHLTLERNGVVLEKDIRTQEKKVEGSSNGVKMIGVSLPEIEQKDLVVSRYGVFESFGKAAEKSWEITIKTYVAIFEMVRGKRSLKEAMGPVGMYSVIDYAIKIGFSYLLYVVAIISLSLAIFNLLPVIPLDGGHLFLLAIEKIRGKALSVKTDLWISRFGLVMILTLAVFMFYIDIERNGTVLKIMKLFKG